MVFSMFCNILLSRYPKKFIPSLVVSRRLIKGLNRITNVAINHHDVYLDEFAISKLYKLLQNSLDARASLAIDYKQYFIFAFIDHRISYKISSNYSNSKTGDNTFDANCMDFPSLDYL